MLTSIFAKELIFHWNIYHSLLLSSLWHSPLDFCVFWLGKIVPAILLSSFVFLFKRQEWTIVISCIIDLWCFVNLTYYRAFGAFVSWDVISLITNLSGFESAISVYIHLDSILYFLITAAYVCVLYYSHLIKTDNRQVVCFTCCFLFAILGSFMDKYLYSFQVDRWIVAADAREIKDSRHRKNIFMSYFPFGDVHYFAYVVRAFEDSPFAYQYINHQSVVSYMAAMPLYHIWTTGKIAELTNEERFQVNTLFDNHIQKSTPETSLILILVESLESWALEPIVGFEYMPNLSKLAHGSNTLYCTKLRSETRDGNSGDGQMILLSGLLPLNEGAACCLYDDNVYPSFVHQYDNAIIVNPSPGAWHQTKMSSNYGFTKVVEPKSDETIDDKWIVDNMIKELYNIETPFCMLGITMASHVPFTYGMNHTIHRPSGMPQEMSNYLNCLYYTDSCIGQLIKHLKFRK